MTALISLQNVTKVYTNGDIRTRAINNLSLTIQQGEFVSIFGKSGSGKTTLMSMLGLLDRPNEGTYFLKGKDTRGLSRKQLALLRNKHIGFIFQSFNLIDSLNVSENIALPMRYNNAKEDVIQAKVHELLGSLGITDREKHQPSQLSGGQQQRVAIARALANSPELLLVDEPTGNLDSANSAAIMDTLTSLNIQGVTICLVTHEESFAAKAQRVILLEDGELLV